MKIIVNNNRGRSYFCCKREQSSFPAPSLTQLELEKYLADQVVE